MLNRCPLPLLLFAALFALGLLQGCGPQVAAPEPLVEDLVASAKALYDKGDWFDAREKFEAIRFDYPGNPFIAEVQFYLGACLYRMKDYLNAEQELRTFQKEFPADSPFSDDVAYYLCLSLFAQALPARLDQALTKKTYEEIDAFIEAYPGSGFAKEVLALRMRCLDRLAEKEFLSGRLYRRMGYPSAAIHYFKLLESDYAESRWVPRGRYEWARALYKTKSYADAQKIADTCGLMLSALESREKDNFQRAEPVTFGSRLVHLFGIIPFETRSDIKIYIDDLHDDLVELRERIQSKLPKTAAMTAPAPASASVPDSTSVPSAQQPLPSTTP
ncbi:MAG: outer membrane protein assembly factor BamD [Fibrobacterota bacterium]